MTANAKERTSKESIEALQAKEKDELKEIDGDKSMIEGMKIE